MRERREGRRKRRREGEEEEGRGREVYLNIEMGERGRRERLSCLLSVSNHIVSVIYSSHSAIM